MKVKTVATAVLAGWFGITYAAVTALTGIAIFNPCEYEDSVNVCHWNAELRGNGLGTSFFALSEDMVISLPWTVDN